MNWFLDKQKSCFFFFSQADDVDADISQFAAAVLSVIPEDEPELLPNSLHLEGEKAILLEGWTVVDGLPDLPKAYLSYLV